MFAKQSCNWHRRTAPSFLETLHRPVHFPAVDLELSTRGRQVRVPGQLADVDGRNPGLLEPRARLMPICYGFSATNDR